MLYSERHPGELNLNWISNDVYEIKDTGEPVVYLFFYCVEMAKSVAFLQWRHLCSGEDCNYCRGHQQEYK